MLKKLILGFIEKAAKVLNGGKEHEENNPFLKAIRDIPKYIGGKIIKNPFELIMKGYQNVIGQLQQSAKGLNGAIDKKTDEICQKIEKLKRLVKVIKFLAARLKNLIDLISMIIQALPVIGGVLLAIILIIVIIMILASLFNLFSFSYGFDKTAYYDNQLFQAVKNKEVMLENIYEKSGETSYYQRFVDAEIESLTGVILPSYLFDETSDKSYKKAIEEAQKSFTGFYSLDSRLTIHDANFNNMNAFIQANTIDSNLESSSTIQGFLRDYFNKEVNFELSSHFLMQLNNKAFAENGIYKNMQLIYPEIFTKPVSYVYDFNRAELTRDLFENDYKYKWKDYTYITQRVIKADVGKKLSDVLVNFNELTWGKYYGANVNPDYKIKKTDEGKIFSWSSPVVWEYIVSQKDDYRRFINNDTSATVTNDYNSEYLLFKNDETGEELIPKFYYLITGNSAGKFSTNGNGTDGTFADDKDSYTFSAPYLTLNDKKIDSVNVSNLFKNKVSTANSDGTLSNSGKWYKINIPEGYRLATDVNSKIENEDGTYITQERTSDYVLVSKEFNSTPKQHIQLANLIGSDGDVAVSSQTLINYKYFKFKTISESYRNKQEYVDNWSLYINDIDSDDNNNFLSSYTDRTFWGAVLNRVSGAFGNLSDAILGIENNLVSTSNESEKYFNIITSLPADAINFSLYLYEKDFVSKTKESDDTWKYDYSVNNYFKTDNKNLDSLEHFQKYFYISEELILNRNTDKVWNTDSASFKNLKTIYYEIKHTGNLTEDEFFEQGNNYNDFIKYLNELYEKLVEDVDMNNVQDTEYSRYIERISNSMTTKYMNLGTVKIKDDEIVGDTIYGKTRKGEVSLISTLSQDDKLKNEMIKYSYLNGGIDAVEEDGENFPYTYRYKNAYDDFVTKTKNWFSTTFAGFKIAPDEEVAKLTVVISRAEHSHLQKDYYIKETSLNKYSSNVFKYVADSSKTENELPLELKSVRDYGLGSILNYVDSVVVEFKSGVSYEEVYLKEQIGAEILKDYKEVYDTYSISSNNDAKAIEEVGEGYYPKEVKDYGGDYLMELFAQNNKKAFFENLVNTLDGKILEISNEYDLASSDPEKNRKITSLNILIDNDSAINSYDDFKLDVGLEGSNGTSEIKLTLDGDGNIKIKASNATTLNKIEEQFENNDIYKIFNSKSRGTGTTTFKYYTPYLNEGPTQLSQLLLPKRYYRSWLSQMEELESLTAKDNLLKLMFYYALGDNVVTKEIIPEKNIKILESMNTNFDSAYSMAKENDIIDKKWYDFLSSSFTKERYIDYLLDKGYNKKNFTEGLSGDYRFISEGDIKKVYLIDEVVTFAGKFMYTYKDTLLTITPSVDETMPKSIIGAYATDRYVFLDSWDVKLLSDRVVDVSFMFFNTKATINNMTIPEFINSKNSTIFNIGGMMDGVNQKVISAFTTDNPAKTYILAVPSKYIENNKIKQTLDSLFKSVDRSDEGLAQLDKSSVLFELEEYTNYIANGFLLSDAASKSSMLNFDGTQKKGDYDGYVDLYSGRTQWNDAQAIYADLNRKVEDIRVRAMNNPGAYGIDTTMTEEEIEEFGGYQIMVNTTPSIHQSKESNSLALEDIKSQYSKMMSEYYSETDFDGSVKEVNGEIIINYNLLTENIYNLKSLVIISESDATSIDISYSEGVIDFGGYLCGSLTEYLEKVMPRYIKSLENTDLYTVENVRNAAILELQNIVDYQINHFLTSSSDYVAPMDTSFSSVVSSQGTSSGGFLNWLARKVNQFIQSLTNEFYKVITGFEVKSKYNVRALRTTNLFELNNNLNENNFKGLFNKYVEVLKIDKLTRTNETEDYFNFKYVFSGGKPNDINPDGVVKITKKYYKYTLKVSDEIASVVDYGRYYSQLSSVGVVSESGAGTYLNEGSTSIINPNGNDKLGYGELLYVAGNKTIRSQSNSGASNSNIYISSETFYNLYSKLATSKGISVDIKNHKEWEELWSPQLKIFDSLNNSYYKDTSMKEYLYGIYLHEDNKTRIPDDGIVYGSSKTVDGKVVKTLGTTRNIIKVNEFTTQTNKRFLIFFTTNNTDNDYGFLDSLVGVTLNRKTASKTAKATVFADKYLKGFKLQKPLEHPVFSPDISLGRTEDEAFKDKTESINLTDTVELAIPTSKIDLNTFTEVLNYFYRDEAIEIVKQGGFSTELINSNKNIFNISGFVLVPRVADRRDEPTIYPLYKYWGGAKKKIEPSEVLKYFEGQTYNSWKNKMTIDESSTKDDKNWFYAEKERLSKYLRAYLENFEAYVPYNIISDSDLEIRGTAGYGDLMTNYTLTPKYTALYSQYFLNEANKSYWSDFLKRYDVSAKDLAQLLQGMAELSLQTAAEDSLNTLISLAEAYEKSSTNAEDLTSIKKARYIQEDRNNNEVKKPAPLKNQDNISLLHDAIIATITGGSPTVKLYIDDKNMETYNLPIVGLAAIDDSIENTAEVQNNETMDVEAISNFSEFMFVGNFTNTFKTTVTNENRGVEFVSNKDWDIYKFQESLNANANIKDKKGFVLMLGGIDVMSETNTVVKTDKYRNLIYNIMAKNPDAKIYIVKYPGFANYDISNYDDETNLSTSLTFKNGTGVTKSNPKTYGASTIYENYTKLNNVMNRYNTVMETTLKNINNDKINILDFSNVYGDGLLGVSDNYIRNNIYFDDSKTTYINGVDTKTDLYSLIRTELFGDSFGESIKTVSTDIKSTKTLNPISEDLDGFEVSLAITKNSADSRLAPKESVAFMSLRLFKLSSSFNDLLKGVYAYYYGIDFVNNLIVATADNASNLIIDPQHGLWYNPTGRDIARALKGDEVEISGEDESKYKEKFGIQKVKDSFSYIVNVDKRKNLVVGAMKSVSTVLGQKPGINVPNENAYEFDLLNYLENGNEDNKWTYTNKEGYLLDRDRDNVTDFNGIKANMRSYTGPITKKGQRLSYVEHYKVGNLTEPQRRAIAQKADNDGTFWFVEEDGVKYYLVALGAAYLNDDGSENATLGGKFIITTDEGNSFYAMSFDLKSPVHTDDANVISIMDGPDDHGVLRGLDSATNIINGCAVEMQSYISYSDINLKTYRTPEGEAISGGIISIVPVDRADSVGSSNSRNYAEEIWEEEYLKYQNTGLIEYVNHMHGDDIKNLISSTANYRNNNQEQVEEGYTYLDFFRNIETVDSSNGDNKFTGKQTDSLLLNAMTYLGTHYSQGRAQDATKKGPVISRFANMDNLTSDKNSSVPQFGLTKWPYGGPGVYYQEGVNFYSNIAGMYGMDCSSFGSSMYIAMGYEFINSTCEGMRSGFTTYPGNDVTADVGYNIDNLKPGDLIINTKHTMIWMGDYAVNFGNLFSAETLKITDKTLYHHIGSEVLAQANTLVGKKVYIHEGGYKKGKSCVNIAESYSSILTKNNAKVYRIFFDDIEYTKKAMEENQIIQPKIFTKTTILNNPYLVEYMESAGILQEKLNTGLFTIEDVNNAKAMLANSTGEMYDSSNGLGDVSTN